MKFVADRPFADLELAARKLVEIATGVEGIATGDLVKIAGITAAKSMRRC
jgi:hypothetical protein